MKKTIKFISVFMLAVLCCGLVSCTNQETAADLWENAVYTKDTELGSGEKLLVLEVKVEEKSVTFKINTDKETVGEALEEHKLISGEQGAYGIYIKQVNGMTADYSKNKSYWSFAKDGEYMMSGVDRTKFNNGDHFELIYTK